MEKVVATIRKLLRMAADPKASAFEAMLAQSQANALMDRHHLNVSLEDDTELVPGVRGVHWKERLLFAAARAEGCRVFDGKNGATIAGPTRTHIRAAILLFDRMVPEATSAAYVKLREHYLSYPPQDLAGNFEFFYSPYDPPQRPPFELFAPVFFRVFINAVLDNVTQRLAPVKQVDLSELRVAMTPSEQNRVDRKEEKRLEEIAELAVDAERLAAVMGRENARQVLLEAEKKAIEWADQWEFAREERKCLPAASSFLPPLRAARRRRTTPPKAGGRRPRAKTKNKEDADGV